MKSVGNRIRERRKALGLTAEDLGSRIGKDRATIYRYENGDIEKLPLNVLTPLANALCTTPDYLMGWTDDPIDYETVSENEGWSVPDDFMAGADQHDRLKAYHEFLAAREKDYIFDELLLTAYHAASPSIQRAIRLMLGLDDGK